MGRGLIAGLALIALTGGSVDAAKPRATRAIALAGIFRHDDYPADALRDRAQGKTEVDLVVNPLGRISGCVVTQSSGSPSIDQRTCTVLRERARYVPARDAKGTPVSGKDHRHVIWRLPVEEVAEDVARLVITIDGGTKVGACRLEGAAVEPSLCRMARDELGKMLAAKRLPTARDAVYEFGDRLTSAELADVGQGPSDFPIMMAAVTAEIGSDGRVSACRPTPGINPNRAGAEDCGRMRKREFDPQASEITAPRSLTNYGFFYLRGVAPRPRLVNLAALFGADDYPADAIAQSREGRVLTEITVAPDGRPSGCAIKESSGTPSLDAAACARLVDGGRYEAARDAQGHAVRGSLVQGVRWALPRTPVDDRVTRAVFALDREKQCTIEGTPSDDVECGAALDFAATALASPDAVGKRALVVEYGQVIGGGEAVGRADRARGNASWYLGAVTVDVDGAGKAVACKGAFDWIEARDVNELCDAALADLYLPLDEGVANRQPRAMTLYRAIYFRS
jgi:TonB family protein